MRRLGKISDAHWAQLSAEGKQAVKDARKRPDQWIPPAVWGALGADDQVIIRQARTQPHHNHHKPKKPAHERQHAATKPAAAESQPLDDKALEAKRAKRRAKRARQKARDKTPLVPQSPVPVLDAKLLEGKTDEELLSAIRHHAYPTRKVSYTQARLAMFTDVDNVAGRVKCVYTSKLYNTKGIPNPDIVNTEHTWPRSKNVRGKRSETDIHHLFPTNSQANNQRGHHPFGIVKEEIWSDGECKLGFDAHGHTVFEPPEEHRGNVARAMFYISSVYGLPIPNDEEAVLKQWHVADPIDDDERTRNEKTSCYQGNRNPFIDDPSLVDRVADF